MPSNYENHAKPLYCCTKIRFSKNQKLLSRSRFLASFWLSFWCLWPSFSTIVVVFCFLFCNLFCYPKVSPFGFSMASVMGGEEGGWKNHCLNPLPDPPLNTREHWKERTRTRERKTHLPHAETLLRRVGGLLINYSKIYMIFKALRAARQAGAKRGSRHHC